MRIDRRKEKTKLLLRDAMVELLKEKPFDQITTTELVQRAHISRSSFYTHYQDKYGMIDYYQTILFSTIQYIFEKSKGDIRPTLLETYEFLNRNDIYTALLSENGSKEIHQFIRYKLKELLDHSIFPSSPISHDLGKSKDLEKLADLYATTYYAHAIFGLTQSWILRNKKESPEQLTSILMKLLRY